MSLTELLDRVSISPAEGARAERATAGDGAPAGGPQRTFDIELPTIEHVGGLDPVVLPPQTDAADLRPDEAQEVADAPLDPPSGLRASIPLPSALGDLPPLPSWGIAVIGALSLLCLAMAAALAVAVAEPRVVEAVPPSADTPGEVLVPASDESEAPPPPPATFTAEPTAIPVELLTRLEEASDESLDVELSRLLEAVQFGFGRRSAQLEPTLRSYVYRMSSRFEWNPDSFRVAVTAPDPALANARAALLKRLFDDAVAAGRLDVGTGIGPHALTLVTE